MALNFEEEFLLQHVDLENEAGLKIVRDAKKTLYPKIYDHLAFISISGICSTTIFKHGVDLVKTEKAYFPFDATYLETEGAEKEYTLFKKHVRPVARYFVLSTVKTEWNTILKAFDFFLEPAVWQAVSFVASFFQKHTGKVLLHEDISMAMQNQPFYEDFVQQKNGFLAARYPLTKEILKV
ncbi:hypothetical protein [Pedobacter sp. MW01-1-1]|uniref:hypothetical protein n=1 Tax=Pedobacter sp. MW01-1-1 TaxID=3383027 RepID=UPI003FEF1048